MLAVGIGPIGPFEGLIILAIVIIIFGVGRLPEVGGAIGRSLREFRKASSEPEESEAESQSEAAPAPAQATQRSCTNCGAQVAVESKHCAECGTAVQVAVQ